MKVSTTLAPPFLRNSPTKSKLISLFLYSISESGIDLMHGCITSVFLNILSQLMPPYSKRDLIPYSLLNMSFFKFSLSKNFLANAIFINLGVGTPKKSKAPADEKCAGVYIRG